MATSKRELFRAAEVCEMAQLQPYVLRTWEAEFPSLGRPSADQGPRVYRRADVERVLQIKQLVFVEGLTLGGARRRLEEEHGEPSLASIGLDDVLGGMARSRLRSVRTGLEAIKQLLDRDLSSETPELALVAPPARRASKAAANGKRRRAS